MFPYAIDEVNNFKALLRFDCSINTISGSMVFINMDYTPGFIVFNIL